MRLCRPQPPGLGETSSGAWTRRDCATSRRRARPPAALPYRHVRSAADSNPAAHSLRVPVLLLQPAKGLSESSCGRGKSRRGINALERRSVLAVAVGAATRCAGHVSTLSDETQRIVYATGSRGWHGLSNIERRAGSI